MLPNPWRWFGDRSKVEPEIPPSQNPLSAAEYEAILLDLLDEVER